MTKGLAIVFTFGVLAAALVAGWYSNRQALYFPPELHTTANECIPEPGLRYRGLVLAREDAVWWGEVMADLGEPSLYQRPAGSPRVVRLVWDPGYDGPMSVRLEAGEDGQWTMSARSLSLYPRYRPGRDGPPTGEIVRRLDAREVGSFERLLDRSGLIRSPSSSCVAGGVDGISWIIETFDPVEGYRYNYRQTPQEGPFYELGAFMSDLAGWDYGPGY